MTNLNNPEQGEYPKLPSWGWHTILGLFKEDTGRVGVRETGATEGEKDDGEDATWLQEESEAREAVECRKASEEKGKNPPPCASKCTTK